MRNALFLVLAYLVLVCRGLRAPLEMPGDYSNSLYSSPTNPDDEGLVGVPGRRIGGMLSLFQRQGCSSAEDDSAGEDSGELQYGGDGAFSSSQTRVELAEKFKFLVQSAIHLAGVAAAAFVGVQVICSIWKGIESARHRGHIRSQSDAFAKAAFDVNFSPAHIVSETAKETGYSRGSSGGNGGSSKSAATMLDLQQEQEEIWRVVHNIYKGHADKIFALESANDEIKRYCEVTIKDAEASLSLEMANLTAKLDKLEQILTVAWRIDSTAANEADGLVEALRKELRCEMDRQSAAIGELRKEVPALLIQHDKVVVSKLEEFGKDVRKLILQSDYITKQSRNQKKEYGRGR